MINLKDLVFKGEGSEKLAKCISSYLHIDDSPNVNPSCSDSEKADKIIDMLEGSKKIRLGSCLCDQEQQYAKNRVLQWMNLGKPIELVSLWGALKGYGQFGDRNDADIMDLMGMRRFEGLHRDISRIYSPGINVKVLREDVGEVALTGDLNLPCKIGDYSRSLDNLCISLGIDDHLKFVDESKILEKKGVTPQEFLKNSKKNAQVFFQYWIASTAHPESEWSNLPEYGALTELGWKGVIPPIMRDHYIERTRSELPSANSEELATRVCIYLGTALARYHMNFYQGESVGEDGKAIPPFKASFVPYPPGTDSRLKLGRFEYKVKDSKTSRTSIPPWAGIGFMVEKGADLFEPHISGVRTYRDMNSQDYRKVEVELNGKKSCTKFRADILPSH
ncbi:MAG: hypothetical protein WC438_04585 [Candidatus Pacearchaeota archaeon]